MTLPTEKSAPSLSPDRIKALLYGPPKIGKSTFASKIDPDHTLFIPTEPGLGSLEVFEAPARSWAEFRQIGGDLAKDAGQFRVVVVDTVDELYRMCSDHVCGELGIKHPSDADYGKGWAAVADEFRLRVGKLAGLGLGVWFISHAEDREVKKKVGTKTVTQPSLSGQARKFLTGFVDFIFLATWEGDEDSEKRVLRTQGAEHHEAGGRIPEGATPLPDPLPLDADRLRQEMGKSLSLEEISDQAHGKPAQPPAKKTTKAGKAK
jgi:hypothetical protein